MVSDKPGNSRNPLDRFDGSAVARKRLRMIMHAMAGKITVAEACEQLNISESRFYQLRDKVLKSAMESMEPSPPGRPASDTDDDRSEAAQLRRQVKRLKNELAKVEVLRYLAEADPELFQRENEAWLKKNARNRAKRLRRRRKEKE